MEKPEENPAKSQGPKSKKQKVDVGDDGDKKDERSPAARIQDTILAACQSKPQVPEISFLILYSLSASFFCFVEKR